MLQRGIELGQRAAAVLLVMQVGERVAEADDRVVLARDVAVQPAPIGLDRLEDQAPRLTVLEGLRHHRGRAVGRGHVKAGLDQPDGMKAGAAGDVEHAFLAAGAQYVDEELPLALGAAAPVDQLVPLLDEGHHVFLAEMVGISIGQRILAIDLPGHRKLGVARAPSACSSVIGHDVTPPQTRDDARVAGPEPTARFERAGKLRFRFCRPVSRLAPPYRAFCLDRFSGFGSRAWPRERS